MPPAQKLRTVQPLPALVNAFSRRRVVVVGDLVADHYIYGQTDRVSREAPVLIVRHESSEVKLGGAANVAANLRSLGAQVTLVGALGDDEMGRALATECRTRGIVLRAVIHKDVETETKTRIYAGGLNTTRQQMLRLDRGSRGTLPPKVLRDLVATLSEASAKADCVVASDYGAGVVGPSIREQLRRLARSRPVCVDSRYSLQELRGVTVAKPNEPELAAFTGLPVRDDAELCRAAERALLELETEALLVTRGRSGMALFRRGEEPLLLPVHGADEAVDVTGAGDTVLAAFSLTVAAGGSYAEAARLANVAGGLVVQKQGTATVSREELIAELPAPPRR